MRNISIYAGILLAGVLLFKINQGEITPTSVFMDMNAKKPTVQTDVRVANIGVRKVITQNVQNVIAKNIQDTDVESDSITIMAFGDVMLGRYVRTLMDKYGKDYIFQKIDMDSEPFYGDADLVFANLEGPIRGQGYKHQTAMVFGFHVDTADFLKKWGFDMLSIANNHALDQKPEGRDTTIQALEEAGLSWCGNAKDVDYNSVHYGIIDDSSYAFVCFNDAVYRLDKIKALELIRDVREKVDYLIVSIHWGYEYIHTPNNEVQVKFAHALIDSGVDFIIGHHPHVVQSFEKYKGKFIFYSLGNFVFDQYWSRDTQEELAIKITLNRDDEGELKSEAELFPIKSEKSQPRLMLGDEKTKWIEKFIGYGKYDDETKEEIRSGVVN